MENTEFILNQKKPKYYENWHCSLLWYSSTISQKDWNRFGTQTIKDSFDKTLPTIFKKFGICSYSIYFR